MVILLLHTIVTREDTYGLSPRRTDSINNNNNQNNNNKHAVSPKHSLTLGTLPALPPSQYDTPAGEVHYSSILFVLPLWLPFSIPSFKFNRLFHFFYVFSCERRVVSEQWRFPAGRHVSGGARKGCGSRESQRGCTQYYTKIASYTEEYCGTQAGRCFAISCFALCIMS